LYLATFVSDLLSLAPAIWSRGAAIIRAAIEISRFKPRNAREHLAALLQQIRERRLPDAAHLRSGAPGRMALSDFHVRFRTVTRHSETGTNGRETLELYRK
jgi:hypothetical protein